MRYKQRENEKTYNFASKGSLCDFSEGELDERIIELIIASTPNEAVQKHMLDQDKEYTIDEVVKQARKHDVIAPGEHTLQSVGKTPTFIHQVKHRYRTVHFHIHRYSVQLTRTNVNIATSLDTGPSAAEKRKQTKDGRKTEVRRERACQEVKGYREVKSRYRSRGRQDRQTSKL